MLIRFIDIGTLNEQDNLFTQVHDTLLQTAKLDPMCGEAIFLDRRSSYFYNKDFLLSTKKDFVSKDGKQLVVYTNDEEMLHFAEYDKEKRAFRVEVCFSEEGFMPLSEIYPNLRFMNNLTAMYHKGVFFDAYREWKETKEQAVSPANKM